MSKPMRTVIPLAPGVVSGQLKSGVIGLGLSLCFVKVGSKVLSAPHFSHGGDSLSCAPSWKQRPYFLGQLSCGLCEPVDCSVGYICMTARGAERPRAKKVCCLQNAPSG